MKPLLLCALSTLLATPAPAQTAHADSSLVAAATQALRQRYTQGLGSDLALYSGPEYVSYVRRTTKGHRFFGTDVPQVATIRYAGRTYAGVPLRYDLVRGQLVLPARLGALEMRLVNEQVADFELGGHLFIRLAADSGSRKANEQVPAGYYEVLVAGPVRLLAAHHKTYLERSTPDGIESEITAQDSYFLEKDHRYYPVSKAAAVYALFPAQKAALRRYAREQGLDFGAATRAQALAALVRYQATL